MSFVSIIGSINACFLLFIGILGIYGFFDNTVHKIVHVIIFVLPFPTVILWLLYIFHIKRHIENNNNKQEYIILEDIDRHLLLNEELDSQEIQLRSKNIIKKIKTRDIIASNLITIESIELKKIFIKDFLNHITFFLNNLNQQIIHAVDPLHHKVTTGTLLRFFKEQKLKFRQLIETLEKILQEEDDDIGYFQFPIEEDPNAFNEFSNYGTESV